jgi:hypothetical protein
MTFTATSQTLELVQSPTDTPMLWKWAVVGTEFYSEGKTDVQAYRQITPSKVDEDAALALYAIKGVEELHKATDDLGIIYWVCGNNLAEDAVESIVDQFVILARRYRSAHLRLEVTDRFDGDHKCPDGLSWIPPMKATYEQHTTTTSAAS